MNLVVQSAWVRPILFLLLLVGCHPSWPTYPTVLRSTSTLHEPFLMRQRITFRAHGHETQFEAVLQNASGNLLLLALTPLGTRAFSITQTGTDFEFESFDGRKLPFPPQFILNDIHRALLLGMSENHGNGVYAVVQNEETRTDRWLDGGLQRRQFDRHGYPHSIIIQYEHAYVPGERPPRIYFDNGWFGYVLEIETLRFQSL